MLPYIRFNAKFLSIRICKVKSCVKWLIVAFDRTSVYAHSHEWDRIYIRARTSLTIMMVVTFAICVSYRYLKRSFRFYWYAFGYYLWYIKLAFNILRMFRKRYPCAAHQESISLCSQYHSYLSNYQPSIFLYYVLLTTRFVSRIFQVH